jgi:predicted dehydrogenase
MALMDKIRLAFLGAGFMGQNAHMVNYSELSDKCEIVALAEARHEMGRLVASRHGIKNVFTSYNEMIRNIEFDAVVSAQPFSNHINIVPMVLGSKKPLLTEKPLCIGYETALSLAEHAEKNNTLHMVAYHKRSDPASEYAKKVIDEWKKSGEFGKMRLIRITMPPGNWTANVSGYLRTEEPYPQIEREDAPAYFPGSLAKEYISFVNYYIHQVNYMRFILGERYEVKYCDKSGVLMVIESQSGISGTLEMAPYSNRNDWQESIFVGFDNGYVKVELPAPLANRQPGRVTVLRENADDLPCICEPILPRISAMQKQAANFIAAVKGEKEAPCASMEAAEDLRIATEYVKMRFM